MSFIIIIIVMLIVTLLCNGVIRFYLLADLFLFLLRLLPLTANPRCVSHGSLHHAGAAHLHPHGGRDQRDHRGLRESSSSIFVLLNDPTTTPPYKLHTSWTIALPSVEDFLSKPISFRGDLCSLVNGYVWHHLWMEDSAFRETNYLHI